MMSHDLRQHTSNFAALDEKKDLSFTSALKFGRFYFSRVVRSS